VQASPVVLTEVMAVTMVEVLASAVLALAGTATNCGDFTDSRGNDGGTRRDWQCAVSGSGGVTGIGGVTGHGGVTGNGGFIGNG